MLYLMSKDKPAKAKVVRRHNTPCLFVEFLASEPPVIWQLDLEKKADYAISLQEKEGSWALGYNRPQELFTPVAHFDDRIEAEESYALVQKALARGEVTAGQRFWRIAAVVIVLLVAAVAVDRYWGGAMQENVAQGPSSGAVVAQEPNREPAAAGNAGVRDGVPLDADAVLSGR